MGMEYATQGISEQELQKISASYSKLLYAVALSILGKKANKDDLEEIVSDVLLRLWQHPEKFDETKSSLKTYLVLMTKSLALNKSKRRKRDYQRVEDFPLESLQDETPENSGVWDIFFQALMTLEEPTRKICLERFFHELKPRKIARLMDLPLKEVNNRLYTGKKKIRKEMEFQLFLKELEGES